jgi:hypothetical protein
MKRREFFSVLGGAAAVWPLAARAQQSGQVRRVSMLIGGSESGLEYRAWVAAFVQGLAQLGWTDGRNLRLDVRWTDGSIERARAFAKELAELQPDVILAATTPVTVALKREIRTIPIVFTVVSDPVGAGFVASLARPDANITGFINEEAAMGGKWLEVLKEAAPRLTRAGIMFNPDSTGRRNVFPRFFPVRCPMNGDRLNYYSGPQRCRDRNCDNVPWAPASWPRYHVRLLRGRPFWNGEVGRAPQQCTDNLRRGQLRKGGGTSLIRIKQRGLISPIGQLCRSHSARRDARQSAGSGAGPL